MPKGAVWNPRHIWLWLEPSPVKCAICARVISCLNLCPSLRRSLRSESLLDGLVTGDKLLQFLLQLPILSLKQLQMTLEDLQIFLQLGVLRINLRIISADSFEL